VLAPHRLPGRCW